MRAGQAVQFRWIPEPVLYDGTPLESLWAYRHLRIEGDAIVAFTGPCDIPPDRIVDLEDRLDGSRIYGPKMLHFIVEHFELELETGVWRQRLLAAIVKDFLVERTDAPVFRQGDDLFEGPKKLSVSIATLTPVSTKIHFGINIDTEGTPVPTKGLADYDVDPSAFAHDVMQAYVAECASIRAARCKVRGIQ